MNFFLARAWKLFAHLQRLEAFHAAQVVSGVVADSLPHRSLAISGRRHVDGITRLEVTLHPPPSDWQQTGPLLSQGALGTVIDEQPAAARLRVLQPQLEAR